MASTLSVTEIPSGVDVGDGDRTTACAIAAPARAATPRPVGALMRGRVLEFAIYPKKRRRIIGGLATTATARKLAESRVQQLGRAGPVMCDDYIDNKRKLVCNFSHEIRRQLNKFWELEEVSSRPKMSEEEEACEQHFVRHTRRLPDGRFCVTLPLKMDPRQLGDSYYIAKKRLDSLEKRFHKQPDVKMHYLSFMREYEALGHSSKIERPKMQCFAHHPVIKKIVNRQGVE
ncbi:hypothetical protein EVAR_77414_1 [Eumeta japonica]|uniref:Uncharacterized protein n=1 Tax=Eumeta variegata TaxID=151549 RepID=A0A4C1UYM9_EUMVA|nr:hypothetical protein EVAR_77414_1 [Eumeta japonica]